MSSSIAQLVFDQFIKLIMAFSNKTNCTFDPCGFQYRVRDLLNHRLLDVNYAVEDDCNRCHDTTTTIDITSICLEDLTTCRWVDYLEKLAKSYLTDICPKKYVIIKNDLKKCRSQPPKWTPLPCKNTTTIVRKQKLMPVEPECEVIIENECECIPVCKRTVNVPKQHVIIKYETEVPVKCGQSTVLVEETINDHDYVEHRGSKDYNHHQWKQCCNQTNDTSLDFYQSGLKH